MAEHDPPNGSQPPREQTDESLRLERAKSDARLADKHETTEETEDEVLRLARERADEVVQTARDDADRDGTSRASEAGAKRERALADAVLEDERTEADAVLQDERAQRKRYLADFLAVEREATDEHLSGERVHADTAIAGRDHFLAMVSHDLRSLLAGLSLNISLLIKNAPDGAAGDKTRDKGHAIKRMVARMNRLIGDLLDIASIDAGKLAVVPEHVEVASILRGALEAFEPIAAAKNVTLDSDTAGLPLHARVDGGRVLQVLANLISNAVKFTPEHGRVSIRIRGEGNEIHFAVSDTGIGIAEDALDSVFERFRQVSKDRRGLGLGLHISKNIVEAHGGRMWAESKLGAGSTFHFVLPVETDAR